MIRYNLMWGIYFPWGVRNAKVTRDLALCVAGQLRGVCSPEDLRRTRLAAAVLQPFEGSYDIFVIVPLENCSLAQHVFKGSPANGLALMQPAVLDCFDDQMLNGDETNWVLFGPRVHGVANPRNLLLSLRHTRRCGEVINFFAHEHGLQYRWVARARPDTQWASFFGETGENARRVLLENPSVLWVPWRQMDYWQSLNDKFVVGRFITMIRVLVGFHRFVLDPENWPVYSAVSSCQDSDWRCIPGLYPEFLWETYLRHGNIPVRRDRSLCLGVLQRNTCGVFALRSLDIMACDRFPPRGPTGIFLRQAPTSASGHMSLPLHDGASEHDVPLVAKLSEFFWREWALQGRPMRILDLGAGGGSVAFELARLPVPVLAVDGVAPPGGIAVDLAYPLGPFLQSGLHADWVICLDVLPYILPKHKETFLKNLHSSNFLGIILGWASEEAFGLPSDGQSRASEGTTSLSRDPGLVQLMQMGYAMDHHASEELQLFAGVFCCAARRKNLFVLRRIAPQPSATQWGSVPSLPLRPRGECRLSLLNRSLICALGLSYGCVDREHIWVALGCAGWFQRDGVAVAECHGHEHWYAECDLPSAFARALHDDGTAPRTETLPLHSTSGNLNMIGQAEVELSKDGQASGSRAVECWVVACDDRTASESFSPILPPGEHRLPIFEGPPRTSPAFPVLSPVLSWRLSTGERSIQEEAAQEEEWVLLHVHDTAQNIWERCAHRHKITGSGGPGLECVTWNVWRHFGKMAQLQLLRISRSGHYDGPPKRLLAAVCGPWKPKTALWTLRALGSGTADLAALSHLEARLGSPLQLDDRCSAIAFEVVFFEGCRKYEYKSCLSYLYEFHTPMAGSIGVWEGPCNLILLYLKVLRLVALPLHALSRELYAQSLWTLEFRLLRKANWTRLLCVPQAPLFRRLFPALAALQHRVRYIRPAKSRVSRESHGSGGLGRCPRSVGWFKELLLLEQRAGLLRRPMTLARLGTSARAAMAAGVVYASRAASACPIAAAVALLRLHLARHSTRIPTRVCRARWGRLQSRLFARHGGWQTFGEVVDGDIPVWALMEAATAGLRGAEGVEFALGFRSGAVRARYEWSALGQYLYRLAYLVT